MKALLFVPLLVLTSLVSLGAIAQDADPSQSSGQASRQRGRGQWGAGTMGNGRGVMGIVTEAASDHFTVKTDSGETYTIHYSVNTHILKGGGPRRHQDETDFPTAPPQPIKATEIKLGDVIGATGELDAAAKSVGAIVIFQIDPERARQIREMQANFGKTWLMGRVTAIENVKVTVEGPDKSVHAFVADENTAFRKRRDPITLADIRVGDIVRAEGGLKSGAFVATSVTVMGQPPQRTGQESGPTAVSPQ